MSKIRCKVSYRSMLKSLLGGFANNVINMLYSHIAVFMTPPIPMLTLIALKDDYETKYQNYVARTVSKADMLASRLLLINALDMLSTYVDSVALGNAIIIGQSGFEATKGSSSSVVAPGQPTGVTLVRDTAGVLVSDCTAIAGTDIMYGTILTAEQELPASVVMNGLGQILINDNNAAAGSSGLAAVVLALRGIIDLNKKRTKKFINLQPGVTYYVYYWAMNSGGVSALSEPVSRMVINE